MRHFLRRGATIPLAATLAALLVAACASQAREPEPTREDMMRIDVEGEPQVVLVPAFGGRGFERPVEIGVYPGHRMFVAEQDGLVSVLDSDGSSERVLLDLRDRTDAVRGEGLLSVALDPDYEDNGHVWAYFFDNEDAMTLLARYEAVDGTATLESELVILEIEQPGYNHNGGALRFGPDGMLYISLGDGSASMDPFRNGQDLSTPLGAILRIDVGNASETEPYAVPPDNPFLDMEDARPEIWAYGFRNPWRLTFDPATGELWNVDVGVSDAEEINLIERGGNYGWNIREGFLCLAGGDNCPDEGLIDPLATYDHSEGRCAIIGGVVYRGGLLPELDGHFLYGDFCTGELFALDIENPQTPFRIAEGAGLVTSFEADESGRVYVSSYDGSVWLLEAR